MLGCTSNEVSCEALSGRGLFWCSHLHTGKKSMGIERDSGGSDAPEEGAEQCHFIASITPWEELSDAGKDRIIYLAALNHLSSKGWRIPEELLERFFAATAAWEEEQALTPHDGGDLAAG
jgi:hypothetical protein